MTKLLKNENGITLLTLVLTVVMLIIITSTLAIKSDASLTLSRITKLQNDIDALGDRVASYWIANGELPLYASIDKDDLIDYLGDVSYIDFNVGEFYVIDLSELDNLTLNYGLDHTTETADKYIINDETHIIYYLKGIQYEGKTYYTVPIQ